MKKSGVQLEIRVAGDLPSLLADAGQLEQVLVNLMVNARDAMLPQGGTLILAAEKSNDEICVSVKDTGSGIPPEIIDQIFDSFFTTKDQGKGTGLGLFICKEIVEQHSGRILLESHMGTGTTFKVILPLANLAQA